MIIAVIGDSACSADEANLSETVGELLAQRGVTVVCGGLGGVKEAVWRGAKSEGGLTVGILPGHDRSMANRWVDIPVIGLNTWSLSRKGRQDDSIIRDESAIGAVDTAVEAASKARHHETAL
ncbi:MAG: hypothetical protein ACLFVD_04140 [Dehalococcoidia bacterium]